MTNLPPHKIKVDLPPKKTASRNKSNSRIKQEPQVKKQSNTGSYDVKIVAPITVGFYPAIVVCETVAPDGKYFLQNINDVMMRSKIEIDAKYITVNNGRLEVFIKNTDPTSHQQCKLSESFLVAKLVKVS